MSRAHATVVDEGEQPPVRILGRGLRAARGVRLTLRTIRDAVGMTQVELARRSRIDQGDVSRIENRAELDDCQLATIRRYIEALGGELQLVARFGDKSIVIVGAAPAEPNRDP